MINDTSDFADFSGDSGGAIVTLLHESELGWYIVVFVGSEFEEDLRSSMVTKVKSDNHAEGRRIFKVRISSKIRDRNLKMRMGIKRNKV